ncbi:MAG: 7-carboxy-7-deazaguanine synthase [Burkholderia plantarii]|nr:MAG: 7-carboxy-7-deazaguanine synthase [Burkholderia plantarii]
MERAHEAPDERMTYSVKEIFYTLQGEGANAGRPAVFCRFSGCNLWTDRETAQCRFCDTDFVGTDGENGGKFRTAEALADAVASLWPEGEANRFVVCTGGEPMLQLDQPLVVTRGHELKVVVPQDNQRLADYAKLDFTYFLVQPMDGPSRELNTKLAIDWCKRHPQWRLSMQTHKYLNIP